MERKTRSLLYALGFLLLAEAGLRGLEARRGTERLASGRPLVFILGTSRSVRGLRPADVEEQLRADGVEDPWVGNVSKAQLTNVGLVERYLEQLHPLIEEGQPPGGVVAIEVRGSGLNDRYVTPEEAQFLERSPEVLAGAAGTTAPPITTEGSAADVLARTTLARLRIARARETLLPLLEGPWHAEPAEEEERERADPGLAYLSRTWARGERGWTGYPPRSVKGLHRSMWRPHYRKILLADYTLGGLQTQALERLIELVREDGFRPVLYVLPITEVHRGFYRDDDYERFKHHAAELARRTAVPLVDLDRDVELAEDEFYDTQHVHGGTVAKLSQYFADRVVLPELE